MSAPTPSPLLETGVPNLDTLLGGGIPREDVLLVIGEAGTGKTTLALQMAFHVAATGGIALYVSTVSEPTPKLLRHIREFAFYDEQLVGKRVFFLNAYPLVKQSLQAVTDALVGAVKQRQASLVIIDGLMSFRDLHPESTAVRAFVYELGSVLATLGCTTVVTSSGVAPTEEVEFPEFTMADGIIRLAMVDVGSRTFRRIRVRKLRGRSPLLGEHGLRINHAGMAVYPRIESVFRSVDIGISPERVTTGMPELDALMSGGSRRGSLTLLAGAMGTGKTLASLQFIAEGARRGEKALFVGFRETEQQIMDKAAYFGFDLKALVADGRVTIFRRAPVDVDLDRIAWEVLQEVERVAPRRLVIDSISEFEAAFMPGRPQSGFFAALAGDLRGRAITSLIVKETPQIVGPELDFSGTPLTVLSENLILFRWVEFRSELYRILSILKMRDSAYDASIRQYVITDRGIHVLQKVETAEGLLTGIARLPVEARRRASPGA